MSRGSSEDSKKYHKRRITEVKFIVPGVNGGSVERIVRIDVNIPSAQKDYGEVAPSRYHKGDLYLHNGAVDQLPPLNR